MQYMESSQTAIYVHVYLRNVGLELQYMDKYSHYHEHEIRLGQDCMSAIRGVRF